MKFEWDLNKAKANLVKHGIAFDVAITVFDDSFGLRVEDIAHSTLEERRLWQIGESDFGVIVVVFVIHGEKSREKYRLISARKASKRERALYEINKRIPI